MRLLLVENFYQLTQLGTPLAWKLVFDRLSHRELHNVQLACRSFRSIAHTRLRHTPIGPIIVSAQMGSWRHEWLVQRWPRSRIIDRAHVATDELVDRLEETCGRAPIPKLVIRGYAPLDHPQLLEYAARHEVEDLVLETDFSGVAYEPLRRFLQSWNRIDSLTISSSKAADSVCVSDELLRDAAALGIEKVSVRCERTAGITDEGILDFWLSATSRSLEVIRPAISPDFLGRLVELNWDDYVDHRKSSDPSGTTYELTDKGVGVVLKISFNEHSRLEEVGSAREYDVLRVTRRRVDG
ncbi:hypothetical protein AAVH_31113 [Aphelenchoides avenae]|nr:hypothetical protein AAVH_31113 [Aphelenchus avenae]